jgi:ribonuclease HII
MWASEIKRIAVAWGVGFASAEEIDRVGIVPATYLAVKHAVKQANREIEYYLVDYITIPDIAVPQTSLVKGDARSLSIASAAILAKVTRDELMVKLDAEYPGYGFVSNKGYATETHREAIHRLGPCRMHRKTFSPVSDYYSLFPPKKNL